MIYRLLGELEIAGSDRVLELPGGPTRVLIAALLLNANRSISKSDLIRTAWGDENVKDAQLHKRVMAVRDLLAEIGRRDDIRTHARFGYELRVAEHEIDSLLFQRLVRQAEDAAVERRTEAEISLLRQALRLWRGHPLSNVPTDVFAGAVTALERRRKRAAVRLVELEIVRGGHERILDELMRIADYYPVDRRLCELHMIAAYRCGHATDAIAAYERYRQMLAEETDGSPDPLLRALKFAIGRGDDQVVANAESAVAARIGAVAPALLAVPRQLPPPPDLVGRADLAAEVSWLLCRQPRQTVPIVVISGPGGIGKTALALCASYESSAHYPDGQLYLDLHGAPGGTVETGEILAQFLRAFGVASVPESTPERLAAYRTLLATGRVLVVLDDVAEGAHIADLVPAGPGCGVVVTARQRLPEVSGAHHVAPLGPLNQADATELYLRVVRGAGVALESDPKAVERVVALCGGLPLALRIAAALRVHDDTRPTAELADRLAEQGHEAFAYGQLSLARTIGAGFDRLDGAARLLFLGLGLLALPDFASWTAAALVDQAGEVPAAALSSLAARFMIEQAPPSRYRFHDLTRDYARRRALVELPEGRDTLPARVYRALLTLARRAHANLYGGDFEVVHSGVADWAAPPEVLAEVDTAPLDWFEAERANIRAAVGHCAELGYTDQCWDLAVSAHEFYTIRGYFDDWYATHSIALEACRNAGDRRGEGVVLACLNQPALVASGHTGDRSSLEDLQRAVDLLRAVGDEHGEAIALRTLGNALRRYGFLAWPLEIFALALARYEASGDSVGRWQSSRFVGQTHLDLGKPEEARRALEAAQVVAMELGNPRLLAQTRYWIGHSCLAVGDLVSAQAAFDSVFETYRDDAGIGHAYAVHGLAELARVRGAYGEAEQQLGVAAELARLGADAVLEGRVWLSTAALHQAQRQTEERIHALEHAVARFSGCGATYLEVRALARLGEALMDRDDPAGAQAAWARVDELYAAARVPEADRIYGRPGR